MWWPDIVINILENININKVVRIRDWPEALYFKEIWKIYVSIYKFFMGILENTECTEDISYNIIELSDIK